MARRYSTKERQSYCDKWRSMVRKVIPQKSGGEGGIRTLGTD